MDDNESRLVLLAAGVLWAVAVTMMVAVTLAGGPLILAGWALMTALWACVWTGWALLLRERHRVHTIAELVANTMREDARGLRST